MISKTAKTKVLKVTEEWSLSTNPVFTLSSSAANLRKLKTMTSNTSKIVATITPEQATEGTQYTTALSLLREEEFLDKTVRVFGTPENPLFLARDVAEWIDYGYKDYRKTTRDVGKMIEKVDNDEKVKLPLQIRGKILPPGSIPKFV